jgi:hypoxanthine phosphoribosyltransferase
MTGRRVVIGAGHQTKRAVIDALAAALDFPPHAGRNLDALYDVLRTEIAGPLTIRWDCPAATRAALGRDFDGLREVLETVAAERSDVAVEIVGAHPAAAAAPGVAVLFEAAVIARRVEELAQRIAATLPDEFTVVGLLKGAFVFTADLVRALDRAGCRPEVEFLQVSSYGMAKESTGRVKVIGQMPGSVAGRNVLLVDDIQDTGRTLVFTRDLLLENGAARVWTCALLDKPSRRVVPIEADFVGFEIPDLFVVGYGIDYAERWRHLPYIGRID